MRQRELKTHRCVAQQPTQARSCSIGHKESAHSHMHRVPPRWHHNLDRRSRHVASGLEHRYQTVSRADWWASLSICGSYRSDLRSTECCAPSAGRLGASPSAQWRPVPWSARHWYACFESWRASPWKRHAEPRLNYWPSRIAESHRSCVRTNFAPKRRKASAADSLAASGSPAWCSPTLLEAPYVGTQTMSCHMLFGL